MKKLLLPVLLITFPIVCVARSMDSTKSFIQTLHTQYQQHQVADTVFLKAFDSVFNFILDHEHLDAYLETYRGIAFGEQVPSKYRISYFSYMGIREFSKLSNGKATFYFEKMAREAEKQRDTIRFVSAIQKTMVLLFNNKNYTLCIDKYATIRQSVGQQIQKAVTAIIPPKMADVCASVLHIVILASFEQQNLQTADNSLQLLASLQRSVQRHPGHYGNVLLTIDLAYYQTQFAKHKYNKDTENGNATLRNIFATLLNPEYPAKLRNAYLYDNYSTAIEFFLKTGNKDSARTYLQRFRELPLNIHQQYRDMFLHEKSGELLAGEGKYQESQQQLATAIRIKDSIYEATLKDRDNNLYAQASADYNEKLLVDAEKNNLIARSRNLQLKVAIGFILLVALFLFLWMRQRQRHRFLNAKLMMARNIHDEIGPMLLYTRLLARKEKELAAVGAGYLPEIENQLNNIMETVRGLSHDLKSTSQLSTEQLHDEVKVLLEKAEKVTDIKHVLLFDQRDKVLNYFQYLHVKNVLAELINNTIRHADSTMITVALKFGPGNLLILYSDNGHGFAPDHEQKKGIGMENVKERIQKLNGAFELNNHYPSGYSIEINIPLT